LKTQINNTQQQTVTFSVFVVFKKREKQYSASLNSKGNEAAGRHHLICAFV
jgi:hypothetical protein